MIAWADEWNRIYRYILWRDYDLKQLMKIPSKATILNFRDKYFIRAGFANELLTNESCRIVYSMTDAAPTDVPNVRTRMITFDIYVKQTDQYDVDDDRLLSRTDLISKRLTALLTSNRYVADTGYHFWIAGEWDQGTRTVGYDRHTISFYFKQVY